MNWAQILQQLAASGRGNDRMLAHISPREAALLRAAGGSGGVNPRTGLREFDDSGSEGSADPGQGQGYGAGFDIGNYGGGALGPTNEGMAAQGLAPEYDYGILNPSPSPAINALGKAALGLAGMAIPGVGLGSLLGRAASMVQGWSGVNAPEVSAAGTVLGAGDAANMGSGPGGNESSVGAIEAPSNSPISPTPDVNSKAPTPVQQAAPQQTSPGANVTSSGLSPTGSGSNISGVPNFKPQAKNPLEVYGIYMNS